MGEIAVPLVGESDTMGSEQLPAPSGLLFPAGREPADPRQSE